MDDVEAAMKGMLDPKFEEEVIEPVKPVKTTIKKEIESIAPTIEFEEEIDEYVPAPEACSDPHAASAAARLPWPAGRCHSAQSAVEYHPVFQWGILRPRSASALHLDNAPAPAQTG